MVLAAISENGDVVTPFRMIAQGHPIHDAYHIIRQRQSNGEKFYCFHCMRQFGVNSEVRFRGTDPSISRPHFFHLKSVERDCSTGSEVTEEHLMVQEFVALMLERQGATTVTKEFNLQNENSHRRPDIVAEFTNSFSKEFNLTEAHEIQFSSINSSEIRRRTEDILHLLFQKYHFIRVCWYIPKSNISPEIEDYFNRHVSTMYKHEPIDVCLIVIDSFDVDTCTVKFTDKSSQHQPLCIVPQDECKSILVGMKLNRGDYAFEHSIMISAINYIFEHASIRIVSRDKDSNQKTSIDYSGEPLKIDGTQLIRLSKHGLLKPL